MIWYYFGQDLGSRKIKPFYVKIDFLLAFLEILHYISSCRVSYPFLNVSLIIKISNYQ